MAEVLYEDNHIIAVYKRSSDLAQGDKSGDTSLDNEVKKYLAEKLRCPVDRLEQKGYIVTSAGTLGIVGFPASSEAVIACAAKEVDISGHRSRALSRHLIEQSELIFAMARIHQVAVTQICPEASDKCLLLEDGADIPDPIGQSQAMYDRCAEQIDSAVKKRFSELVL